MQDLGEPTNLFVNRKTNKMEWNDIEKHQVQTLMVIHIKYIEKNEHIFYVFCILFKENERKKSEKNTCLSISYRIQNRITKIMQKILAQQRTFKWRCEVFIASNKWKKNNKKNSAKNSTENRKYLYCSSKLSKQMIKKRKFIIIKMKYKNN